MTRRPKVCMVGVVRPAGDVRTLHRQAASLAAAGWEVTVIGREAGPVRGADGVRLVTLPSPRGVGRLWRQATALRLALATRADVYQVTDMELLPAALLLKRLGRSVVYDCREDYAAYMLIKAWLPPRLRPLAAGAVARLERFVAPRLDAVTTADEGTAARLRASGARVSVLFNFPRRDHFTPAPSGTAKPHDVLYHGSLPPYHLVELAGIARALARRRPATRWTIVGQPDSAAAGTGFGEALAAAGLSDRVTRLARIGFAEVPALLHAARTGVVPLPDVPKFRRNIAVKLFEYLAAGVPPVASDLPPVRALLGDANGAVLVPPGDHDAFAAALADLLDHPAHAAEMARRGRAAVVERFHWEAQEPRLLGLYAGLLCGPGLGAVSEAIRA
jgi:glycosyltransferase involved in cell wall biosynthesis